MKCRRKAFIFNLKANKSYLQRRLDVEVQVELNFLVVISDEFSGSGGFEIFASQLLASESNN